MPDWRIELRARLANAHSHIEPANEAEIIDEMAQHFDDEFAELRARGLDERGARRMILAQLDDPDFARALLSRRRARPAPVTTPLGGAPSAGGWVASVGQDVRYGLRALRRSPAFTIVAVLSLAIGIGATTAIFGLLNAVLLERLAVRRPNELVQLRRATGKGQIDNRFAYSEYLALKDAPSVPRLEAAASSGVTVVIGDTREYPYADVVTGGFFDMIGVRPLLGRTITIDDEQSNALVVVVSQNFWEQALAGDRAALGRAITINDHQFTVIGVLPRAYRGMTFGGTFTLAVPLSSAQLMGLADVRASSRPTLVTLIARLTPGWSAEQGGQVFDALFQQCCAITPLPGAPSIVKGTKSNGPSVTWHLMAVDASRGVASLKSDLRAEYRRILAVLMAGVTILLLIVCANVGSLQLARASARQRELAVRMSMGATASRIARQLITESLEIGVAGAALGLVFARLGTVLLAHNLPPATSNLAEAIMLRPSAAILAFTAITTLACTLFFGVLPALRATRVDVLTPLKDKARSVTGGRAVVDRGVVVAQVALALVLVCAATLFVTTLRNLERTDETGPSNVLLAGLDTRGTIYAARGMLPLHPELVAGVRALPGVTSAAMSTSAPVFGGRSLHDFISVPGYDASDDDDRSAPVVGVTPGYFSTIGIAVERGRAFDDRDGAGAERVAVVSRAFAQHFFQARDPIGGSIVLGEGAQARSMRIVGVVRDAKYEDLRAAPPRMYYVPLAQSGDIPLLVVSVRSLSDPTSLASSVRRELERIAPGIRVGRVTSFDQAINDELARERLTAGLALLFGMFALGLAAIGIYGVVAYNVARRTSEIGIRMALGARPADALWLVVRQTMTITAAGVVIGVPLAFVAARAIGAQLYGIGSTDPRAMIGAALLLGVAGGVASVVPGWRAARVDPVEALRGE